jgi:SAM-dependent methyltransferase
MSETNNPFVDGEAYERSTARWSRAAGEVFLGWLSLPAGLRWLDVGCGTGALTELIVDRCSPSAISGVDPSADQITFAKSRSLADKIDYQVGDAQQLPFDDLSFDVVAMALVLSFIPDQPKAVSEMVRVVRPGGTVGTFNWDLLGGGHFQQPIRDAIKAVGVVTPPRKSDENSRVEGLVDLFSSAGLEDVSGHQFEIQLDFPNFDEYWDSQTGLVNNSIRPIKMMSNTDVERVKAVLRERLPTDSNGRISFSARCNAAMGVAPE